MQADLPVLIFDAALAGMCILVLLQLVLSGIRFAWQIPLMLVFVGALWVQVSALMLGLAIPHYLSISGNAAVFLAIGSLWVYTAMITEPQHKVTEAKTNSEPVRGWGYHWVHYRHLWPLPVALLLLIKTASLPEAEFTELLATGDIDSDAKKAAITPYLVVHLILTIWTLPYLLSILRRLSRYRKTLQELYSSTENLELLWISALVGVIFLDWCRSVLHVIDIFGPEITLPWFIDWPLDGLVILIPALWGLRQIPGMREPLRVEEAMGSECVDESSHEKISLGKIGPEKTSPEKISDEIISDEIISPDKSRGGEVVAKYDRSALEDADIQRIAGKIEQAMNSDHLYREPGLSLSALSSHIGVTPNYISQTLNVHMRESFFVYVNRLRVLDAEKTLRGDTSPSSDTIIQIAYDSGFNSRSSFYKAFKKEFGCAPAAYRKRLQQQAAGKVIDGET